MNDQTTTIRTIQTIQDLTPPGQKLAADAGIRGIEQIFPLYYGLSETLKKQREPGFQWTTTQEIALYAKQTAAMVVILYELERYDKVLFVIPAGEKVIKNEKKKLFTPIASIERKGKTLEQIQERIKGFLKTYQTILAFFEDSARDNSEEEGES